MIHKPIQIKNLSLSFSHKTCFDNFNAQISYGNRIAIIGRNGGGKSSLLNILRGTMEATSGDVFLPVDVHIGFVPQVIHEFDSLSGGQRLNAAVTQALSSDPNLLLLDEPTNHLDQQNRKSLMRMLQSYSGTLIVVSHDTELLRHCVDTLWHIDNGYIHIFNGCYDDYMREKKSRHSALEEEITRLNRQKKDMHHDLMREQKRASKSNAKGKKSMAQGKWSPVVGNAKASRAEEVSGRKKSAIDHKKKDLTDQLSNMRLPETILPKFSLASADIGDRILVSISNGAVGYIDKNPLLQNINISIHSKSRMAIQGDNASGKSTLIRAILGDDVVIRFGDWSVPQVHDIGYLDQHYRTLSLEKTVLETIEELVPSWTHIELRSHLNDFLFRKNEEVNSLVSHLSGGEKARLSLAQIAAKTPKLLILDEITNNLDLETREHVTQVLKSYPGALIAISHDADFLTQIEIDEIVDIRLFKVD
jgi:ATPase subunit of ABC transporter with duplicated ATPase domains